MRGAELYWIIVVGTWTALLAVIGHITLVVPAYYDPRCCISARFTYWFGLAGFAIGLIPGALVGGLIGYGVSKIAAIWLLAGENENK